MSRTALCLELNFALLFKILTPFIFQNTWWLFLLVHSCVLHIFLCYFILQKDSLQVKPLSTRGIKKEFKFRIHCVKSVHIRSFSGPSFRAFGLNTETYKASLRIQSKCGKIRTRKTPNTDTFNSVITDWITEWFFLFSEEGSLDPMCVPVFLPKETMGSICLYKFS